MSPFVGKGGQAAALPKADCVLGPPIPATAAGTSAGPPTPFFDARHQSSGRGNPCFEACLCWGKRAAFQPLDRIRQPIIAPEKFASRNEAWSAENPEFTGLISGFNEPVTDPIRLR